MNITKEGPTTAAVEPRTLPPGEARLEVPPEPTEDRITTATDTQRITELRENLDLLDERYKFHKHCCFCNFPFTDKESLIRDMACPKCKKEREPQIVKVPM